MSQKIRVLHVDDSAVIRSILRRIIQSDDGLELITSAINGEEGVKAYQEHKPDIVILDIEMPVMDGIEALRQIIAHDKNARVMMCSTLTLNNAEIALKAMAIGALDYIAKPTSATEVNSSDDFRTQLIHKVKSIQTGNVRAKQPQIIGGMPVPDKEIALRPAPPLHWKPKVIAVGSSTGGPQALLEFMKGMGGMKVPIVITQHMPPTFTTLLAKNITNTCGIPCHEAEDDMPLKAGEAILARGGKHMIFEKTASGVKVKLSDTPPENFCKPAVDPMIRSLMEQYSSNIVTVMLTGMGHDGQKSVKELVDKGGYAIAQDQGTSVVWGMPGAIAMDGSCSAVLPLTDLAPWIKQHVNF